MPKLRCRCPGCQKLLQFEADRTRALRVNCPQCQRDITIPAAESDAAAESLVAAAPQRDNPLDDLFAHLPPAHRGSHHGHSAPVGYGSGAAGSMSNYAPPRSTKKLSPKAKKQIVLTVSLAGGTLALLLIGLFVAVPLLKQVGAGRLAPSSPGGVSSLLSFDSRESVLRELASECDRIEATGRDIPKGDQSAEAAKRLLDGRPKLIELLRRACRLKSVPAELADASPGGNGGLAPQPMVANADPNTWFWRIDASRKADDHVTDAINQLTSLRIAVQSVATVGVLELPSPLEAKAEEFQWTDENRRVLSALHLQGRFLRDFARTLAHIDPDAVNAESMKPLHQVIDQYSKAARELVETSRQMLEKAGLPSHRIIIEEPKRTPYHLQSGTMFSALISLKGQLKKSKGDPHFDFVMKEADQLSEDIADIMFGVDPHAVFVSEQSSLDRYEAFAAKQKAEAERLAALEAKKAREAEEKQRLAEERRREEEVKREQAKANEAPASSSSPFATRPAGDEATTPFPGGFPGSPGRRGPRSFAPPRTAFGPDTRPSRSEPTPPPRINTPPEPQSTVTIEIRSESNFDSNAFVKRLSEKTGVRNFQSSQSNNKATLRFTDNGDLKRYVDAIDFGTVESVDESSRTIKVTIP